MSTLSVRPEVVRFRDLIAQRLGLYFDEEKLVNLATLLTSRSGGNSERYLAALSAAPGSDDEYHQLALALTVTETYFFRNANQISAFAEVALPARLAAHAGNAPVRILSAGCASGEEPFTLAIVARDHAGIGQVELSAIDANPAMLAKAARARYSRWALRDLPGSARERWFAADGDGFVLDDAIRDAVHFSQRNLALDDAQFWQPESFDIVFCRNVLMYFAPAPAQAAVERIARSLVPGGYLFLGHAETLRGLSADFHLCHTHDTFYYQRKHSLGAAPGPQPDLAHAVALPSQPPLAAGDTSWVDAIAGAARRIDALAAMPVPAAAPLRASPDLQHALTCLHSGQFGHSLDHIGRLAAEHASDPDVLLLKAVSLSQSGATADAQRVCRQLLAIDELNAGAHYVLALCREEGGDRPGARGHYQSAAYLDPSFAMARLRIGLLERRLGDHEAARRELSQALRLLQQEEPARLLLFGGGFPREALVALCSAELAAFGARP